MSRSVVLIAFMLACFVAGCALDPMAFDPAAPAGDLSLDESHDALSSQDPNLPEPHVVPQNCCYAPPAGPASPTFCNGNNTSHNHVICLRSNGTSYGAAYCGIGVNGCALGDVCFGPYNDPCNAAAQQARWTNLPPGDCLGQCEEGINNFPPVPVTNRWTLPDGTMCCNASLHRLCNDDAASAACGCSNGAAAVTSPSFCAYGATPMVGTPYYCCNAPSTTPGPPTQQ